MTQQHQPAPQPSQQRPPASRRPASGTAGAPASDTTTRRRLLALLRSPVGLRQVMVARDVLGPPVALRGRPGGPHAR